MPWALHEQLTLAAFPHPHQLDKYGWEASHSLITLCPRRPAQQVIDRFGWWSHLSLVDGAIKDMDNIVMARDTALSMMGAGYFCVLHCNAGRNRSGLVGALVIRDLYNWTGTEALEWVRQCRPRAVANPHFEKFLNDLGRPR